MAQGYFTYEKSEVTKNSGGEIWIDFKWRAAGGWWDKPITGLLNKEQARELVKQLKEVL